jgi:hypothetical protein
MNHDISFTPTFEHLAWTDGLDRVTAGGDNGFNARFQLLQADLDRLADTVAEINTALNDDRERTRAGLSAFRDGVVRHDQPNSTTPEYGFTVAGGLANDFEFSGGISLVGGAVAQLPVTDDPYRYSTQPWTDPAKAAADGVPVIGPLTIPTVHRTDWVYLDTWERVVTTPGTRRLVREVAVRVAEGVPVPPPAPGHGHLPVAMLNRTPGAAVVPSGVDIRQLISTGMAVHRPVKAPLFQPEAFEGWSPWQNVLKDNRIIATKPSSSRTTGVLELTPPPRARLISVKVGGNIKPSSSGQRIKLVVTRVSPLQATPVGTIIGVENVDDPGPFTRSIIISAQQTDDESQYHYLYAWSDTVGAEVEVHYVQPSYLA